MSEKISSTNENDYSPVNKYIDEQSKLRRAKSFWINARSWALILIAIGIVLLVFGSDILINSAIEIAKKYNVSEAVIGLSLIAFGTSLPELVVGILSAIKKKVDFALGNILGSNIYNILGVLGISSLFSNFTLPEIFLKQDLIIMVAITSIVLIFMLLMKKIGRIYGILGLSIYASYLYYIF